MAHGVTLDEVEKLTEQLPTALHLRLLARISERLSRSMPEPDVATKSRRIALAKELLNEVADIAADAKGDCDAAETLHALRAGQTEAGGISG